MCSFKFMPVDLISRVDWFFEESDDLVTRTTVRTLSFFLAVKI